MSAELHQVVRDNLEVARRVLRFFELKKLIDEIPSMGRPLLSKIRGSLSARVEEIRVASLPLVLVFVASCLEHYLREKIPIKEREKLEKEKKLGFEKLIERFSSRMGENLALSVHEMRIKRNVILHKAGVIDNKALKDFEEKGLMGYSVGAKLVLSEDEVRGYIDVCEKICNLICARADEDNSAPTIYLTFVSY
jgi:hypothetical protein